MHVHVHLHLDGLGEVVQAVQSINVTLREGFHRMSEASDNLAIAVSEVANKFDTLNTTLQQEMSEIAAALTNTGDADLRAAATDAAQRLSGLATQLDNMNSSIQNIIP